jgi:hypothetical protein
MRILMTARKTKVTPPIAARQALSTKKSRFSRFGPNNCGPVKNPAVRWLRVHAGFLNINLVSPLSHSHQLSAVSYMETDGL